MKPFTMSMIAFGLFLVMRTTIARYVLVEIQDDVFGEIAGRAGKYQRVSSGSCASHGLRMVSSKDECELVATILGLGDTTASTIQPPGIPPGCMISNLYPPWLGWNPRVEGDPCGTFSQSQRWDCLCIKVIKCVTHKDCPDPDHQYCRHGICYDRCFRLTNDYVEAIIKGSSDLFLRNTNNALLCAALVRDKYPDAIGATWGKDTSWNRFTGVYRDCYADFGPQKSKFEYSSRYLACKFKGTYSSSCDNDESIICPLYFK